MTAHIMTQFFECASEFRFADSVLAEVLGVPVDRLLKLKIRAYRPMQVVDDDIEALSEKAELFACICLNLQQHFWHEGPITAMVWFMSPQPFINACPLSLLTGGTESMRKLDAYIKNMMRSELDKAIDAHNVVAHLGYNRSKITAINSKK